MPFFFCRLVPPRPDFATTLGADEMALMGRHGAHLAALGDGLVVMGPVDGPHGSWGLAVIEAADRAVLERHLDADPTVLSGRGFRYEIEPMLLATRGPVPTAAPSPTKETNA